MVWNGIYYMSKCAVYAKNVSLKATTGKTKTDIPEIIVSLELSPFIFFGLELFSFMHIFESIYNNCVKFYKYWFIHLGGVAQ